MISWIQRTFQHHFRIVFGVMLAVLIVSFIMTIGAVPGIGNGHERVANHDFFGHNLTTDLPRLAEDAYISIELQIGSPAGLDQAEVQGYALRRVACLHLADQLHLPAPTAVEVTEFIKTLRPFAGPDGRFDSNRYDAFRASLGNNPLGSEADFARVIQEDVRAIKVQELLDGPGYVLPADVRDMLAHADTSWTIATAAVDYASFHPAIAPTELDLVKFFQQNDFRYQIPPRVVASYIPFATTNYLAGVTVTDDEVRAYYDANRAQFPAPASKDKAKKPDATADFAAARPHVEAALRLQRAQSAAVKAASDVAYDLYSDKVAEGRPLEQYLAAHKLDLKPLAPFTRDAGPAELGGGSELAEAAFRLNSDRYFSEALAVPSGGAIVIWHETQPAHNPLLAEVRDKVKTDYIENEKRQQFAAIGRTLKAQIEARLKSGATFAQAAAAAGAAAAVKVEVKTLPAFTLRARPKELNDTVASAFAHSEKGQVSDMTMTADKGYLVYTLDKQTPNPTASNPRYVETRAQLAAYTAHLASREYLAQIVEDEEKRGESAAK